MRMAVAVLGRVPRARPLRTLLAIISGSEHEPETQLLLCPDVIFHLVSDGQLHHPGPWPRGQTLLFAY